ncbi:MAG: hypothetical protein ABSF80_03715 [Chitinispirillaceae bacterium]|jgi:hypothetical protein
MKKSTILIALFFLAAEIQAQSYEGYIENIVYTLPVWVDLVIPASDGTVTGTYFYKQYGSSIILTGTKTGSRFDLIEKDDNQKITGTFTCTDFGDSIKGKWKKKKKGDSASVRLYKTDPAYKKLAKIPRADKLVLKSGISLQAEVDNFTAQNYDGSKSTITIQFAEKNLLVISTRWWSSGGANYPDMHSSFHTFDLTTNKEISLPHEIRIDKTAALDDRSCAECKKQLLENRKRIPDAEWIKIFRGEEKEMKPLDEYFMLPDSACNGLNDNDEFLLEHDSIAIFTIHGYFGFPNVIQCMDFDCCVELSYKELETYLKPTSILRNLAKNP